MRGTVAIIGLGEIGRPLQEFVARVGHETVVIDVDTVDLPPRGTTDVVHVCFPFEIPDFIGEVARYVDLLEPRLTVINSTVAVGTTRAICERTGRPTAHSPVRGKHVRMVSELQSYVKYVGGIDAAVSADVAAHFEFLGMQTRIVASPETSELAKLTETTYFGLLIAWAQQLERYCDRLDVEYDEVASYFDEIPFLPPRYFPGVIGGHCVMPNIEILTKLGDSEMLDAIRSSNAQKQAREGTSTESSALGGG